MPLAVTVTQAVLSGVVVLVLIAVPYWFLYRIFRHDSHKAPDED
jgi:hypothetical protein